MKCTSITGTDGVVVVVVMDHMKFDNDDVRRVAGGHFRLLSSFNMSSYRSFLLQS